MGAGYGEHQASSYVMGILQFLLTGSWRTVWEELPFQILEDFPSHVLKTCQTSWQKYSPTSLTSSYSKPILGPQLLSEDNYHLSGFMTFIQWFTIVRWFERLVIAHIYSSLPESFEPLQFAYCCSRSVADTISLVLQISLEHLDNTFSWLVFIGYSSTP